MNNSLLTSSISVGTKTKKRNWKYAINERVQPFTTKSLKKSWRSTTFLITEQLLRRFVIYYVQINSRFVVSHTAAMLLFVSLAMMWGQLWRTFRTLINWQITTDKIGSLFHNLRFGITIPSHSDNMNSFSKQWPWNILLHSSNH